MVNQVSSLRSSLRADLSPAVGSLRTASARDAFVAGDAGYDGALSQGWLIEACRSFADVLSTKLGPRIAELLSGLQIVRQPWWKLSNRLLTDVGKTCGDAETEKLLHWQTMHYPCEPLEQDIRLQCSPYRR
jgi:hypothetical protein